MNTEAVENLHRGIRSLLHATRYGTQDVVATPSGTTARAWSTKGDRYSRRCTFRKTLCHYRVQLPDDFDAKVAPIRDTGRLYLNAEPTGTFHAGYPIYHLFWLHKSVGFSLEVRQENALRMGSELVPETELPRHLCLS